MKSWSSEHWSAAMAGWKKHWPSKQQCFRQTTWGLAVKSYEEDASKADVQTFFCKLMKKEAPRLQHNTENLSQHASPFAFVCDTLTHLISLWYFWILQYSCSGICLFSVRVKTKNMFTCIPSYNVNVNGWEWQVLTRQQTVAIQG